MKTLSSILLIVVLCLAALGQPAIAQTNLLADTGSFTVCYAHSFKGSADGLIGKLGVDLWSKQLSGDRTLAAGVDLVAVPQDGKAKFGIGGSVTIGNGIIGLGLGVAYLPGDWGWSWTVTAVQLKF